MNTWNPDLVSSLYEKQAQGFITNISGQVRLQPPIVANNFRKIKAEASSATEKDILTKAVSLAKEQIADPSAKKPPFPYTKPTFGYVVEWLSELGRMDELDGLLAYADEHLDPTWENGGLFYPRNDTPFVFDGQDVKWTHMDPFSGNAAIGYGRLNVPAGQRQMYEAPWTREHLRSTPWIDNLHFVDRAHGVSVLRALWDYGAQVLVLTVQGWDFVAGSAAFCPESVVVEPVARALPPGTWAAYVDGDLVGAKEVARQDKNGFGIQAEVKRGEEVDIVFVKL
jgi:hypothetical protein